MEVCLFTNDTTLVKNEVIWYWVELNIHFIIPFIVIVTCNISILAKAISLAINRWRALRRSLTNMEGVQIQKRMLKTVTIRIIVLSLAFCVGVGPIHLYRYEATLQVVQIAKTDDGERRNNDMFPLYIAFTVLMYLNNAINFFLYCVIGAGFRKDLMKLFRKGIRGSFSTGTS